MTCKAKGPLCQHMSAVQNGYWPELKEGHTSVSILLRGLLILGGAARSDREEGFGDIDFSARNGGRLVAPRPKNQK